MEKDADDDDDVAEELKQDFVDEETGEAPRRSYTDSKKDICTIAIFCTQTFLLQSQSTGEAG